MAQAQQTLLLTHEISSVLTAIRYTSRWSLVSSYYVSHRSQRPGTARVSGAGPGSPGARQVPVTASKPFLCPQEEERSEPNKYDDAFRALKREIYRYGGELRARRPRLAGVEARVLSRTPSVDQ